MKILCAFHQVWLILSTCAPEIRISHKFVCKLRPHPPLLLFRLRYMQIFLEFIRFHRMEISTKYFKCSACVLTCAYVVAYIIACFCRRSHSWSPFNHCFTCRRSTIECARLFERYIHNPSFYQTFGVVLLLCSRTSI